MSVRIEIPKDRIAEFCRKWEVKELAIFGSALGEDFRPDSDVDVLVIFQDEAKWDLFDHMKAEEELKQIFGREVDLVEKTPSRTPWSRSAALCATPSRRYPAPARPKRVEGWTEGFSTAS